MTQMIARVRRCWCGTRDPWMPTKYLSSSCYGTGTLSCYCGGDLCVCHNHGEVECGGCPDCEPDMDDDTDRRMP